VNSQAVVVAGLILAALTAACSASHADGSLSAGGSAGSNVTASQARAVTEDHSLWVAGTLTDLSIRRWCIRNEVATICARPSAHLQSETMPPAFTTGATVHARLSGSPAGLTWTAVVMHVG
jgi:hypothetical protein